jgi:hypothetical protein
MLLKRIHSLVRRIHSFVVVLRKLGKQTEVFLQTIHSFFMALQNDRVLGLLVEQELHGGLHFFEAHELSLS